jgi:hypothetical protein
MNPDSTDAAESGAVDALPAGNDGVAEVPVQIGIDPALSVLVKVWGELPDSVKNRILRLAVGVVQS